MGWWCLGIEQPLANIYANVVQAVILYISYCYFRIRKYTYRHWLFYVMYHSWSSLLSCWYANLVQKNSFSIFQHTDICIFFIVLFSFGGHLRARLMYGIVFLFCFCTQFTFMPSSGLTRRIGYTVCRYPH